MTAPLAPSFASQVEGVPGQPNTVRFPAFNLVDGWYTRTYPHLIPDTALAVADNFVYTQDGLLSKRPGNINYGGGNGKTGSAARSLSGYRFYPPAGSPTLLVQSGGTLYSGADATGAFTAIDSSVSASQPLAFEQMYDPDMSSGAATALIVCDGSRVPQLWDGTHFVPVTTTSGFLPVSAISGASIKPKYVRAWKFSLVYSGESSDPTAVYISDALRPERFTGNAFIDSTGQAYSGYYPSARNGAFGVVTGIETQDDMLVIFYTSGIIIAQNTGTQGAFQFQFYTLSSYIGCPSPRSIVNFGDRIVFFGGDRFYQIAGLQIEPLLDNVPTLYSRENISYAPPLIADLTSVIGTRRGLQYWASYAIVSGAAQSQIAVFDFGCNQGRGAWTRFLGMPLAWGVECRGPGDTYQMFWGSSQADQIAQYDTGVFSDFGTPIAVELQTKAFTFGQPAHGKIVQSVYGGIVALNGSYTLAPIVSLWLDGVQTSVVPLSVTITPSGVTYGSDTYGSFTYSGAAPYVFELPKAWPPTLGAGLGPAHTVAVDIYESSTNSFGIIGVILETTVDEPTP